MECAWGALRALYNEASICRLLDVPSVSHLQVSQLPRYWERLEAENSYAALAVAFWLLRRPVRRHQLVELVGEAMFGRLREWGFITLSDDVVSAEVDLYPCLGDLIFTDMAMAYTDFANDHVYELGSDSYLLSYLTPRRPGAKALDLCTGSGLHAIQSARVYAESVGVDLNPRALRFAAINAEVNGVGCRWLQGDLYAPVEGQQFDLITINPPFVPTPDEELHLHRGGGPSGEDISRRAVEGVPRFLAPGGTFSMILDFPVMRDSSYLERLRAWLGGPAGWGVALLNFGRHDLETYIQSHLAPHHGEEMRARYRESYRRQGIEHVEVGNVFIRRLPPDHPGVAVERVRTQPTEPIQGEVEAWLGSSFPLTEE